MPFIRLIFIILYEVDEIERNKAITYSSMDFCEFIRVYVNLFLNLV
jgi:hypothetical protein